MTLDSYHYNTNDLMSNRVRKCNKIIIVNATRGCSEGEIVNERNGDIYIFHTTHIVLSQQYIIRRCTKLLCTYIIHMHIISVNIGTT